MIDDEDQDGGRDPIEAAFANYRRAPRDVVPRTVVHSLDDLRILADGAAQVTVTHYEYNDDGVTAHSERVGITAPFIESERENG
jgi:hypothetical protein